MKMSPFFVQLGRILAGYVTAAIIFGVFLMLGMTTMHFNPSLNDVFALIGIGAGFAGFFAAPVALLLVILSEWQHWRHWGVFAGVGTVAGCIVLTAIFVPGLTEESGGAIALLIMIAGCAASGLTYWAIAGRHAGKWRG